MKMFPKIKYEQRKQTMVKVHKTTVNAYYDRNLNEIVINVEPDNFNVEYELYGFKGLIRSLSATIIHELTHWASKSMFGHGEKVRMANIWRSRNVFQCSLWQIIIHSMLYDLQRKDSIKTYFEVD